MSGAPQGFAAQFWEHQHQKLANLCTAYARCVAADVATFGEAVGVVSHYAWKHGAGFLPADAWDALHDWIISTVGAEITRAEADGWDRWPEVNYASGRVP